MGNFARAHGLVSVAIRKGKLPKLDGTIKCTDCEKPAKHYDHRDYLKPLKVAAVCISCNHKRGSGINKGKRDGVTMKMPEDLYLKLKNHASRTHRALKTTLELIIEEYAKLNPLD